MQVPFRRELNTEYADSGYSMLNITQNITHKIIAEIADISSVTDSFKCCRSKCTSPLAVASLVIIANIVFCLIRLSYYLFKTLQLLYRHARRLSDPVRWQGIHAGACVFPRGRPDTFWRWWKFHWRQQRRRQPAKSSGPRNRSRSRPLPQQPENLRDVPDSQRGLRSEL